MTPVYITPRLIARYYLEHEDRLNEDAEVLLILPDGTPMVAAWLSWGVRGEMILQVKPEKGTDDDQGF